MDLEAGERQRLLVNELNHRVKNTLATVQSIAWQTFKGTDPETFERFSGRLTTLSGAHNVLTETAWAQASLREIADAAIETLAPGRITATGPDIALHPKAAVSLSMALHELGTNALWLAAFNGNTPIVETLLAASAELEVRAIVGRYSRPPVLPPEPEPRTNYNGGRRSTAARLHTF